MAISKIKKIHIFVHQKEYVEFVSGLKKLSAVEIIPQSNVVSKSGQFGEYSQEEVDINLNRLEYIISCFKKHLNVRGLDLPQKEEETLSKEQKISFVKDIYQILEKKEKVIQHFSVEIQRLENKISLLKNFESFDGDISKLNNLKVVKCFCGKVGIKEFGFVEKSSQKHNVDFIWENQVKNFKYFVGLYLSEEEEFVNKLVKDFNIEVVNLTTECEKKFVKEEIELVETQLQNNKRDLEKCLEEIKDIYYNNYEKVLSIYKDFLELNDYLNTQNGFASTNSVRIISCWLPEENSNLLVEYIKKYDGVDYVFSSVQKGEDVPVVLKNKPIVQPYEFVTTLYSYPKQDNIDPTSILAPFFTLFFGLCMSDIVYGILLLCAWFIMRKRIKTFGKTGQIFVLAKYLGILTIVGGIVTDSFMGFSVFKKFGVGKQLVLFDPLNRPIDFLKFSFLLGLVQIIFGMGIKMVRSIKQKNFWLGVEMFLWQVLIIALVPSVYKLIFVYGIDERLTNISLRVAFGIMFVMLWVLSRDVKNFLLKPFSALYKLYSVVGYFSDIFSYARILALSLAGAAISQTINLMASTVWQTKFIGPVAGVVIFIFGHSFNFAVNCLGAFVHSARLQYLEFFSKFFEGGGRPIKYFSPIKNLVR